MGDAREYGGSFAKKNTILDMFQEFGYLITFVDCQDAIRLYGRSKADASTKN